ncbi:MAG TPA: Gfo/Idh/MocA family oxidoreductase [Myxococcales bacterium]|jgi:glucose-fructose oxidoreductase
MPKLQKQGRKSQRAVGYAVIGLGHIAQTEVLPAFANSRSAKLVAVVSGDKAKRRQAERAYAGVRAYGYEDTDACLASEDVDAVYIAEPNTLHAEFAVRAAQAGVHVLCEKPMAPTEEECRRIIDACRDTDVKLMIAYRLHFEEANLRAVDLVRKGRLGEPRLFSSVFSYQARPGNIRLKLETGGGPAWDIGVYCVNAARYLFADEPIEVTAFAAAGALPRFAEVEEGMGVLLRFPRERLAAFTISYGAAPEGFYEVVGTEGRLRLDNAYDYDGDHTLTWKIGERERSKVIPESDQFGPELSYFSECVLADRQPEPSGQEGLADVRIISAIYKSAAQRTPVKIEPVRIAKRPGLGQLIRRPPVGKGAAARVVDVEAPTS